MNPLSLRTDNYQRTTRLDTPNNANVHLCQTSKMAIPHNKITQIVPIRFWTEGAKPTFEEMVSIIPEPGRSQEKFFYYMLDQALLPPGKLKTKAAKFAYAQELESYLRHKITPLEAEEFRIDPASPARNGHLMYMLALHLWQTTSSGHSVPALWDARERASTSGMFGSIPNKMQILAGRPRPGCSHSIAAEDELLGLRSASLAGIANIRATASASASASSSSSSSSSSAGGTVTKADFLQTVDMCAKIAEDMEEYHIGRQIIGRKVYGLPDLVEGEFLRKAEMEVVEPRKVEGGAQ